MIWEFAAKRLLLFGSGVENPAAALEETLGVPVDFLLLDPPTPITQLIEKRTRVLL